MSFLELAEKRKSVRRFLDKPVDDEMVDAILSTVKLAPSAGNLQAYEVVVVKNPEQIKKVYTAYTSPTPHKNVQILLVFLADAERSSSQYSERGATLYAVQDATIACCYAMLAAADIGLGSVWVGAFDEGKLSGILGTDKRPVSMLAMGYPAEDPARPPREG